MENTLANATRSRGERTRKAARRVVGLCVSELCRIVPHCLELAVARCRGIFLKKEMHSVGEGAAITDRGHPVEKLDAQRRLSVRLSGGGDREWLTDRAWIA